jgi:hypothetical protein
MYNENMMYDHTTSNAICKICIYKKNVSSATYGNEWRLGGLVSTIESGGIRGITHSY